MDNMPTLESLRRAARALHGGAIVPGCDRVCFNSACQYHRLSLVHSNLAVPRILAMIDGGCREITRYRWAFRDVGGPSHSVYLCGDCHEKMKAAGNASR